MKFQKGIGMMEIIVSMLVLGIAILGFIALQYRSLELASEALKKVEAMNLARNLAERIYVNRTKYANDSGLIASGKVTDCVSKKDEIVYCSSSDFAAKDVADIQALATLKNMDINILTCPNTTNQRKCVYVAWDETKATQGKETDQACTPKDNFSYLPDAKCVVVEAF